MEKKDSLNLCGIPTERPKPADDMTRTAQREKGVWGQSGEGGDHHGHVLPENQTSFWQTEWDEARGYKS